MAAADHAVREDSPRWMELDALTVFDITGMLVFHSSCNCEETSH